MSDFTDNIDTQFEDINTRLDDSDTSMQDLSDNVDSNLNDVQTNLDDLNNSAGQLTFPLSQDTIDLITEQTPAMLQYLFQQNYIGTATLVAGTKTIANQYITVNSLVLLSVSTAGGTQGILSYTITAGSLVINSSSATDTSTIVYLILTS